MRAHLSVGRTWKSVVMPRTWNQATPQSNPSKCPGTCLPAPPHANPPQTPTVPPPAPPLTAAFEAVFRAGSLTMGFPAGGLVRLLLRGRNGRRSVRWNGRWWRGILPNFMSRSPIWGWGLMVGLLGSFLGMRRLRV